MSGAGRAAKRDPPATGRWTSRAGAEPARAAGARRVERDGAVVAIAQSEPYARVGGPDPYHDSSTIAVLGAGDLSAPLRTVANDLATRASQPEPEILHGDGEPPAVGVSDAVSAAFRRLFR